MQIIIEIDGEEKTFVTEKVPMLARRKFTEVRAKEEEIIDEKEYIPAKQQIEFDDELINILVDVVFKNQFTADQLINGVTDEYYNGKLSEAVFGKRDEAEGNEKGE